MVARYTAIGGREEDPCWQAGCCCESERRSGWAKSMVVLTIFVVVLLCSFVAVMIERSRIDGILPSLLTSRGKRE